MRWRRIKHHHIRARRRSDPVEHALAQDQAQTGPPQFVIERRIRRGLPQVALDEQVDPAARPAGGDGKQAFRGGVAEGGGKPGDHHEPVFFGDGARLFVVFRDVGELVAEIHLDDFFDVLVDFREPLFDMGALGPDPVMDQGFLVIREMHQPGEVLAKAHRIDEHKRRPAGRMGR